MKRLTLIAAAGLLAWTDVTGASLDELKAKAEALVGKMTLEEKLGQMNLDVAGDIVTGGTQASAVAERIAKGELGGVFNIKGAKEIRELQEIAVKKSRLGIPLIVGMDVIHGYETIFPIPLALSCSWDLEAIENSARIAAKEASCICFSPKWHNLYKLLTLIVLSKHLVNRLHCLLTIKHICIKWN